MDNSDEVIPKVLGCEIGISIFPDELEPVIVLSWHPVEGDNIQIAISTDALEGMLPSLIGGCIRSRTVAEMVTIYPEKREEILRNIMFRWTGQIVEENGDGSPA